MQVTRILIDVSGVLRSLKKLSTFFIALIVFGFSAIGIAVQAVVEYPVPGTAVSLVYSVQGGGAFNLDSIQKLDVKLLVKDAKVSAGDFALRGFVLEGFDARMPEHNHGMITKPVIQKKSDAEYTIDGVKLHMAGKWVLEFKVSGKSVKVPVEIK